ncbi:glycosyl transferase family 2 [Desulfofarcimen acetoxidans DSM 771]|uniref:Glycosyl transferase family 2 n=1 Tax=Desulfofarcimen acetoxidans (strain ATCC 49208 / DSM 771 / KCTC 5769 / VKM B-1644 / 5575) TaxID=485916 RepID=C8VYW3_DESAS|nr:glycosyltransferase family 2 protein [Desulfofarcimen acetoxidans]ACV62873.1 glycosyl transferase family 2 [Desulfofarcimen acetoxidans DSM 771]
MQLNKKVSVLIPAYNEDRFITATLQAVKSIPEVDKIVVVDDGSQDMTVELARAEGVTLIVSEQNAGKGGALNLGAELVKNDDIIVLLDADLGLTAAEARKLVLPVLANQADMTIAQFPRIKHKGGFGLVKGLAHKGIKYFTRLEMQSPLSGQRAMTKDVFNKILPFASGYGVEVALTINVARMGYKVMEVPVQMTHDLTGRNWKGFVHRGKQFKDVLKELFFLYFKKISN